MLKSIIKKILEFFEYEYFLRQFIKFSKLKNYDNILNTRIINKNLKISNLLVPKNKKIIVIAPHPDDEIFGLGGTLIKLKRNFNEIYIIYLTSKNKDKFKEKKIKNEIKKINNALKINYLELENYPGKINLKDVEIIDLLKKFQPDIIFCTYLLDDHVDHRSANYFFIRFNKFLKKNITIYLYQIYSNIIPNYSIDITDVFKIKKKLIKIYKNVPGNKNWLHYIEGLNLLNSRYLVKITKKKQYSEIFFKIKLKYYLKVCKVFFKND